MKFLLVLGPVGALKPEGPRGGDLGASDRGGDLGALGGGDLAVGRGGDCIATCAGGVGESSRGVERADTRSRYARPCTGGERGAGERARDSLRRAGTFCNLLGCIGGDP